MVAAGVLAVCLALTDHRIASPSPADPAQQGCGTLYSKFGEDQCLRMSFSGEVSAHQDFERKFGKDVSFRLNSHAAMEGWFLEVVPGTQPPSGYAEYVWVVNPPYHFQNIRYLDTSYGISAKQAVAYSPRDFNFVVDQQQYEHAAELVEHSAVSHSQSEHKTQQEFEKESQDALQKLEELPVSKGRLTILQSRVTETGNDGLGSIEWISFRVELHVPCDFVTLNGATDLQIDKSKCSAEAKDRPD